MRKPLLCLGVGLALAAGLLFWLRRQPPSTQASPPLTEAHRQTTRPARSATEAVPARSGAELKAQDRPADRPPVEAPEPLAAFRQWSAAYVNASPTGRAAMTAEGIDLAEARRPALKQLIKD